MRILVIEDDPQTAAYLRKGLKEGGYAVDHAADGVEGEHLAAAEPYALLIVDRNLPRRDGLSVIRNLRARGVTTPILILSQLSQTDHRVEGLRAGADDYLPKPYAFAELMARVEALIRRASPAPATTVLTLGDLRMDLVARSVSRQGRIIDLQPREFQLLEYLLRHAGQVVTRTMLLEGVWGYHFDPQTNVIDVHISRLRQKIDTGFDSSLLRTVRGAGYCLRVEV
ncbi:MAG TPA: response regulator transcription factor [Gammaproteobacteria bacterium]|nr:response regulator transcription factor [Gammaproteobacteria bacterium]